MSSEKILDGKSALQATIRMYSIVLSNQLALARLLALTRSTPFEEERDRLIKESNVFLEAICEDLGVERPKL